MALTNGIRQALSFSLSLVRNPEKEHFVRYQIVAVEVSVHVFHLEEITRV